MRLGGRVDGVWRCWECSVWGEGSVGRVCVGGGGDVGRWEWLGGGGRSCEGGGRWRGGRGGERS